MNNRTSIIPGRHGESTANDPMDKMERMLRGREPLGGPIFLPRQSAFELERLLASSLLPPTVVEIVEREVADLQPGDISEGRVGVRHMAMREDVVKLGIAFSRPPWFAYYTVQLFDAEDIRVLAQAIRLLDSWDKRNAEEGGGSDA